MENNKGLAFVKKVNSTFERFKIPLLLIFPAFYLFTGAYFRTLLGDLSLRSIDPDYIYFSNGLGVSIGAFNTGNIYHPGSPLQYFVAVVFRLIYFLRSPDVPYLEDVFANPDLYLSITSFCITGLLSLFLFIAGVFVFRITKSILYGLLIQTTVFLPIIWFDLIGRITPEVFQAFSVLALSIVIIKYYWENKSLNSLRTIFLFAIILAFGLSTKVTFIPLIIIPLFIIERWKRKILFLTITLLLFLIISISVLLKIDFFWDWIRNIFLHSGDYGAGKENIVDFNLFKTNLIYFLRLENWYFKVVFVSFLTLVIYLGIKRKKTDIRIVLYSSSLVLTIIFHLLIVCKHFAHRNFVPSLLLLPLVVFFTIEICKKLSTKRIITYSLQIILIAFLIVTIRNQVIWFPIKSNAMGNDVSARKETQHFTSTLEKNSIKIITSQSYGCPLQEYAVMYSTAWSQSDLRERYKEILDDLYPGVYQYFTWDNTLKYWGEPFDAKKVIESGKNIYLYLEKNNADLFERTITKLKDESQTSFIAESNLLYNNSKTDEAIFELKLIISDN